MSKFRILIEKGAKVTGFLRGDNNQVVQTIKQNKRQPITSEPKNTPATVYGIVMGENSKREIQGNADCARAYNDEQVIVRGSFKILRVGDNCDVTIAKEAKVGILIHGKQMILRRGGTVDEIIAESKPKAIDLIKKNTKLA